MNGDDLERAFYRDWEAGKVRRVSDGKRMVPEREWVGLTDDELHALHYELKVQMQGAINTIGMYRILEKALKEKNT